MKHTQQTIDYYGSRKSADRAYKKTLAVAIKRSRKDGCERYVCDDCGEFFICGSDRIPPDYPVLASTYDYL